MEKDIRIKTYDGKYIYGVLNGSLSKPLVILIHGLCGSINGSLIHNAVDFFDKKGYSTFRFNLYSWQKDARKFHQTTLKIHGKDIDSVLKYFKLKKVKKIFLAGHSYGLPSILHSQMQDVKAIASWDGSYLPYTYFKTLKKIAHPKGRILDHGPLVIMGEPMVSESTKVSSDALIKKLTIPIKFITITDRKNGNIIGTRKMFRVTKSPKAMVVIKNANHNFLQPGKQVEVYSHSLTWFNKYR